MALLQKSGPQQFRSNAYSLMPMYGARNSFLIEHFHSHSNHPSDNSVACLLLRC